MGVLPEGAPKLSIEYERVYNATWEPRPQLDCVLGRRTLNGLCGLGRVSGI